MKADIEFPETLTEAIHYFADTERATQFMASIVWPDGKVCCPKCHSQAVKYMPSCKRWNCRGCKGQFSAKVGTIFEDSPLGFDKWLPAVWMIINAKNGVSSCELARSLGVTQKTAWFMLHRIRLGLQDGSLCKFAGNVEVDETWIGGKARNMHKERHKKMTRGTRNAALQPVMGLLERGTAGKASRVKLKVIETTKRGELQHHVKEYVLKGSEIHTDALKSYNGLADEYTHNVIDHAVCYAKGHVHTNGLENFWSLLKRAIRGTYVSVEPFHLFRYLDEQAFRFNERKNTDAGRFLLGIVGVVGKRLTYAKLIGVGSSSQEARPWETEENKRRRMRRKPFGGLGFQPA
jgi:transposase-like protein